jgi:hypothetical protein
VIEFLDAIEREERNQQLCQVNDDKLDDLNFVSCVSHDKAHTLS